SARAQELDGQLTNQSQTEHDDPVSQARTAPSHAVKRDRAERPEGSFLERDLLRELRDEVLRHEVDAGMVRESRAAARHAVAWPKACDLRRNFQNDTGAGITGRLLARYSRLDQLDCALEPVGGNAIDHFPDERRVANRLHQKALVPASPEA